MIYTKIEATSPNKITLKPLDMGNYTFSEFNCKIYESGTISRDMAFIDRTVNDIVVTSSSLADGTTYLEEAAYWLYACFKNKRLDKIGLCKDGNTPINYTYYNKINFVLSVNSSLKFLSFSDAEIRGNQLVNGGWYGITDNNLEASGVIDYISAVWGKMQLRRVNDVCQMRGLGDTTTAFSQWAVIIYLPYGFKPSQNQMFAGSVSDTFGVLQAGYNGNISTRKAITSGYFFSVNAEWYI